MWDYACPNLFIKNTNIWCFLLKIVVTSQNTSFILFRYFDQFIQNLLKEGRYKNASEVVRAGLRLLEEEEKKIIALRQAINEGVNSGIAEDFDPDEHLKLMKSKRK
jgi:antitoxin ParD1/3/4